MSVSDRLPVQPIEEGTLLWEPPEALKAHCRMRPYMDWLAAEKGLRFSDYGALWEWSVQDVEAFWASLWAFFGIQASKPYEAVLEGGMPGARWFRGAELNYAEHVFRKASRERPALLFQSESQPLLEISWEELEARVSALAAALTDMGIRKGDRIVAYMPNIPETVMAFLAAASIGAVWSSCSPDFGTASVIDRFKQIAPRVLFAVDGYQYGGKAFDRMGEVARLQEALTHLEVTVLVPYLRKGKGAPLPETPNRTRLWAEVTANPRPLRFTQVPFDHPLWVVYSSGTTGLPKGLVHGHGGILLEFLKFQGLHMDVREGDRFFWFSTTGWVMWNIVQGALLLGAIPVLFDGNPGYPDLTTLWRLAEKAAVTVFGTSAAYITACMQAGLHPARDHALPALRTVGSTGSPLSPEGFRWIYEKVKPQVWLASVSGGTDPCSAFLGSSPLLPVHAGELQCRCLGIAAQAFDDTGNPLVGEVGELVITKPFPSMPLYLWNDQGNRRYVESYFETYPGIWRHGDWIRITPRGSAVILGRSDSTLKRQGVRMGSSEIYRAIEDIPEVLDSLIVGYERDGVYHMPLFVVLKEGVILDQALKDRISRKIRATLTPRHVPDSIDAIPEVPKTLNNKKLEVPVKKILMGIPLERAVNLDSMSNPGAIRFFADWTERR